MNNVYADLIAEGFTRAADGTMYRDKGFPFIVVSSGNGDMPTDTDWMVFLVTSREAWDDGEHGDIFMSYNSDVSDWDDVIGTIRDYTVSA